MSHKAWISTVWKEKSVKRTWGVKRSENMCCREWGFYTLRRMLGMLMFLSFSNQLPLFSFHFAVYRIPQASLPSLCQSAAEKSEPATVCSKRLCFQIQTLILKLSAKSCPSHWCVQIRLAFGSECCQQYSCLPSAGEGKVLLTHHWEACPWFKVYNVQLWQSSGDASELGGTLGAPPGQACLYTDHLAQELPAFHHNFKMWLGRGPFC